MTDNEFFTLEEELRDTMDKYLRESIIRKLDCVAEIEIMADIILREIETEK